jgi:glucose-1-phosphate thymidylyltransferase
MTGNKQLLPVYDKPMIYYPLATLMLAGIRDILIISTPEDTPRFETLLGDGSRWGIHLSYAVQETPGGIGQAFLVGEAFIGGQPVCLILGDNLFYGKIGLDVLTAGFDGGALIFGYPVSDPGRYGVVEFDGSGKAVGLEEKPARPRSRYAVPGLYLYDREVVDIAKRLRPSARGEIEITDINREYMRRDRLHVEKLGRGIAWLDTGTPASLLEAGHFIGTIEARQGLKIACLEEIALRRGLVSHHRMEADLAGWPRSGYRDYVLAVLKELTCG